MHGSFLEVDDPRWSAALKRLPHDVYHTPGYAAADAARDDHRAIAFLGEDDEGLFLQPLIERALRDDGGTDVVSPYGYSGPACDPDRVGLPTLRRRLAAFESALAERQVRSAFIRLHPFLNAAFDRDLGHDGLEQSGTTVSVDLRQGEQRLWATMRKGHQNAVNKARRAGFQARFVRLADGLDDFQAVYADTLARLGASAAYEFGGAYFESLARLPECHLVLADLDGEVAGAYVFFECNGFVQMHLGGTKAAFMRPSPSNFLIHAVCHWAMLRGNGCVHLGGGLGGSDQDSLFTFKSGFSPLRHRYFTLRIVPDAAEYDRLVHRRAAKLGTDASTLVSGDYFPAYRARPATPTRA